MKKKGLDILFGLLFFAMLAVPGIMLDRSDIIESEQENRRMTMWPGVGFDAKINAWYGHYVEDRVGFRPQAITAYTEMVYGVFHEFSEDMHMYGRDGEVFPADQGYIRSYQRLNTDTGLMDQLATYLANTSSYVQYKKKAFVFTVGLDKKTIYGDYFPDYIHVNEKNTGNLEYLLNCLDRGNVPYVVPVQEFREAAETERIYNSCFDSAHWNPRGEVLGLRLIDQRIQEIYPDIPVLSEDSFDIGTERKEYLEFVKVRIDEDIPSYKLKMGIAENGTLEEPVIAQNIMDSTQRVNGTSMQYYINENAMSDRCILIFHDSFLESAKDYYWPRYREVIMLSRQNYENMQYYVNVFDPDVVLYENAERSFVDDLYAYTALGAVTYESPYESLSLKANLQETASGYSLTEVNGAALTDQILIPDKSTAFCGVKGQMNPLDGVQFENMNIYVNYMGEYWEAQYTPFISPQDKETGMFCFNFLTSKMESGTMELIGVDQSTGTPYLLGKIEVRNE